MLLLLAQLGLASSDYPPPRAELVLGGETSTTLDLFRPWTDADKIYVRVGLPDGTPALFLVDTGASISVVHRAVVESLGLPVTPVDGRIEGLSGSVPWQRAVLPRITLGEFQLNAVDVAVDVPGVPEVAGALPIAGILGNNVWTNFTCVVDYPADVLELHAPGTYRVPKSAPPLVVDGMHAFTPVSIRAAEGTRATVVLELDTGAQDVLFRGGTGEPFRRASTEGVEPVLGIGADLDELPLASFLQVTRRVPLDEVKIGGRTVPHEGPARWYGADDPPRMGIPGLLGYGPMSAFTAVLDFPGQRFQLRKSRRVPRDFDANAAWLALERERHGDDPARAAIRARLQYAAGDNAGARATVLAARETRPEDVELAVLLSWIQRNAHEWSAAIDTLAAMPPLALAEEHEWIAYVASLIVEGQNERALREAQAAVALAEPDAEVRDDLLVALSDALLANGKPAEAASAIAEAVRVAPGGGAHLLRKARVTLAEGDRYGALVALHDLWGIYPLNGTPIWLYATLSEPGDRSRLLADIEAGTRRLHPGDEPFDFVGAALLAAGEAQKGAAALDTGYVRDCEPLPEGADRANCDAWYWSLGAFGGKKLPEARARADKAIAERPWSSAYRDTAATVALATGDTRSALEHATMAARLSPGDPYLLWQLDRIRSRTK